MSHVFFYGRVGLAGAVKLRGHGHAVVTISSNERPLGSELSEPDGLGDASIRHDDAPKGMKLQMWATNGTRGDGVSTWDIGCVADGLPDRRCIIIGDGHLIKEQVIRKHGDTEGSIVTEWRLTLVVEASIHTAWASQTVGYFLLNNPMALALVPTQLDLPEILQVTKSKKPERRPAKEGEGSKAHQQELFDQAERRPNGIDVRPCPHCTEGKMTPGLREDVDVWVCDSCPHIEPWVDPLASLVPNVPQVTQEELTEEELPEPRAATIATELPAQVNHLALLRDELLAHVEHTLGDKIGVEWDTVLFEFPDPLPEWQARAIIQDMASDRFALVQGLDGKTLLRRVGAGPVPPSTDAAALEGPFLAHADKVLGKRKSVGLAVIAATFADRIADDLAQWLLVQSGRYELSHEPTGWFVSRLQPANEPVNMIDRAAKARRRK